jgi:hypothetical protein
MLVLDPDPAAVSQPCLVPGRVVVVAACTDILAGHLARVGGRRQRAACDGLIAPQFSS